MAMVTIGGVPLPNPMTGGYKVNARDLDSSNSLRPENGILNRDRIRAGVYSVEITFIATDAEAQAIATATAPVSFTVVFYSPFSSSNVTATMYAANKEANLMELTDEGQPGMWEITLTMTEY